MLAINPPHFTDKLPVTVMSNDEVGGMAVVQFVDECAKFVLIVRDALPWSLEFKYKHVVLIRVSLVDKNVRKYLGSAWTSGQLEQLLIAKMPVVLAVERERWPNQV